MSASTTVASTKSLSLPREPVSAMTAALIVGEKLTTMTTISAIIASLAVPTACGAIGSHGHADPRHEAEPRHRDCQRDDGRQARAGHAPLEPLDVQRETRR